MPPPQRQLQPPYGRLHHKTGVLSRATPRRLKSLDGPRVHRAQPLADDRAAAAAASPEPEKSHAGAKEKNATPRSATRHATRKPRRARTAQTSVAAATAAEAVAPRSAVGTDAASPLAGAPARRKDNAAAAVAAPAAAAAAPAATAGGVVAAAMTAGAGDVSAAGGAKLQRAESMGLGPRILGSGSSLSDPGHQ